MDSSLTCQESVPSPARNHPSGQNTYLQLTPSVDGSQSTEAAKSRRGTVPIACERCRRRKVKCSGLPGPCMNCARLNVSCYEPGKRKNTFQGTLEDRIRRLKALTAANRYDSYCQQFQPQEDYDSPSNHSYRSLALTDPENMEQDSTRFSPHQSHQRWLNLNTAIAADRTVENDSMKRDNFHQGHSWTHNNSAGMDLSGVSFTPHALSNPRLNNVFSVHQPDQAMTVDHSSSTQYSDHPAQEISSTDHIQGEILDQTEDYTPLGFTISYDTTPPDDSDIETLSSDHPTSLLMEQDTNSSSSVLSTYSMTDKADTPNGYSLQAPKLPYLRPNISQQASREKSSLLSLILQSTSTQDYVGKYIASVHGDYPFLNLMALKNHGSLVSQSHIFGDDLIQQQAMSYFQTLLAAAIGALVHYGETNLSSQYVDQAVAIRDQFEAWNSIGSIHCALLLALYCYLAQRQHQNTDKHGIGDATMQPTVNRYPISNLWLYNCQIVAACIDLDLHQPLDIQGTIRPQLATPSSREICYNTIRSAYLLDRQVSELRGRPTALHRDVVDSSLLLGL